MEPSIQQETLRSTATSAPIPETFDAAHYPDFKIADVAADILANSCVPGDLTGSQTEEVFDSIVNTWMLAKGWLVDGAVRSAILSSLMRQHGDSYTLYQHYIDASIAIDDLEEAAFDENDNFTDQKIAVLERYIAAATAYGDEDIKRETAELRRLVLIREARLRVAA
ncbi:hypothetical protein [Sinorhizobium fredii]|uniref:hypothetical protein n=1 Tax=Rhizobium fredii TaxID=380 RepID=UPI003398003F